MLTPTNLAWSQDRSWSAGAFVDAAAVNSLNSPANHIFRSRGTTARVDDANVNLFGAWLRKDPSSSSRIGFELTAHGGEDAEVFGFSATAPNMSGAAWLTHLGPTNISLIAPVGNGLTVQAGIFSSLIGYDSLYSKDNVTYTRPWAADFTPYLMMGANARYAFSERVMASAFVVNGYWHLAHANDVPSVGGQIVLSPAATLTIKQTVLYGPHQEDTSLKYWRVLSDTIVERRFERGSAALEFQASTEQVTGLSSARASWIAAHAPVRVVIRQPLSVAIRPEMAIDRSGRWTAYSQAIIAHTTTLEYRAVVKRATAILRLEHRIDRSTGNQGGFFRGATGLTPGQQLVILGCVVTL